MCTPTLGLTKKGYSLLTILGMILHVRCRVVFGGEPPTDSGVSWKIYPLVIDRSYCG